jgi:hypothetical protein
MVRGARLQVDRNERARSSAIGMKMLWMIIWLLSVYDEAGWGQQKRRRSEGHAAEVIAGGPERPMSAAQHDRRRRRIYRRSEVPA